MEILPYTLNDARWIDDPAPYVCKVWQPSFTCLILGQSNKAERSLRVKEVEADGISVMKRPSGGETVLIGSETLVISIAFNAEGFENPSVYFSKINHRIIEGLEELGVTGLSMRGISDISYGDLKILGSSIFRRKQRVLYHAVLNVALPVTLISRYIAHPPKEPDYRKGRSHEDFVTNLRMLGCTAEISHIANVLRKTLELPF